MRERRSWCAAAYGICLAMAADPSDEALDIAYDALLASRPTAINLRHALDAMRSHLRNQPRELRVNAAYSRAAQICEDDVAMNTAIGDTTAPSFCVRQPQKKAATRSTF